MEKDALRTLGGRLISQGEMRSSRSKETEIAGEHTQGQKTRSPTSRYKSRWMVAEGRGGAPCGKGPYKVKLENKQNKLKKL